MFSFCVPRSRVTIHKYCTSYIVTRTNLNCRCSLFSFLNTCTGNGGAYSILNKNIYHIPIKLTLKKLKLFCLIFAKTHSGLYILKNKD